VRGCVVWWCVGCGLGCVGGEEMRGGGALCGGVWVAGCGGGDGRARWSGTPCSPPLPAFQNKRRSYLRQMAAPGTNAHFHLTQTTYTHTWSVHSKKVEGGGVLSASVNSASGITSARPIDEASAAAARTVTVLLAVRGLLLLLLLWGEEIAAAAAAALNEVAGRRNALVTPDPAATATRAASMFVLRIFLACWCVCVGMVGVRCVLSMEVGVGWGWFWVQAALVCVSVHVHVALLYF
jgi:hypothetical protein